MVAEELRTYFQVLWRYKWMIVACAVAAAIVALSISLMLTPLYSATATLRVASAPGGAADYTYLASFTRLSNTYVEIATSDITLNEIAERLNLQEVPDVEVEVIPETELIEITATNPDPYRARDIANTLASMLIEQSAQLYGGSAPTARQILEEQLTQAKVDLDNALSNYEHTVRDSQPSNTPTPGSTTVPNPDIEISARLLSIRQQIYLDLLQKYESARTNEQLRSNFITIVEPAIKPVKPASPKIAINLALGVMAGFVGGLILAFLFETMDDTLRGMEDIQRMTTLPILSTIPNMKRTLSAKVKLGTSRNGYSSVMAAFHQLQARVILSSTKPKSNTLIITSPEPGAGKSTVAANLAISLAEGGHRVILVDMDFRRPRQHSILGLPNEKGMSDYMRGDLPLHAILQTTSDPNLTVVVAGPSLQVPYEWLTPAKIGSLLKTLGKDCNYILIDTPALLSVADPTVLASQVDSVILVVARRKTKRQHLQIALQQLKEINVDVLGVVLNRVSYSHLYSYYSEQKQMRTPFQQETITSQVVVDAQGNHSPIEKK